jgi:hypothetical protein
MSGRVFVRRVQNRLLEERISHVQRRTTSHSICNRPET